MIKYLSKAEFLLLGLLAIAVVLESIGTKLDVLYLISLAGLALVFFLFAQVPNRKEEPSSTESNEKDKSSGFQTLLGFVIVPKVLWIGTAVATIGILFFLQDFKGAENLLTIGGITIAITTVILLVLRVINVKNLHTVIPILYRSYPTLLAAAYLVFA
ncbi:hypothetical protein MATR_00330 [Marivirga tractuosa]|uniref:Uncharacterized protein n=1 Tax=Marivirga tractuosa (strain ATCC 23168 / DSM 4126 / NBRC 15989 / NCIMB 1408 / VKM B-1430 / H-43) TaxID=643867 RepID=E4TLM1_MARTH|nr:hypothetical protein [Marivirga tractuosa]ADR22325.1 hypothetical protein Ftrac_2347 [Marivirga tractuosa DSM 4126]BDD13208.1 hypothetical protein MATR_00330 [Marivirga tractuosa]